MSFRTTQSNTSYRRLIKKATAYDDHLASEQDGPSNANSLDPKLVETIKLLHALFKERSLDDATVSISCDAKDPADGAMPEQIERFAIRGILGSGGFATVYRGFDEVLQRDVAIKALRRNSSPNLPDEQRLREARAVARLSHPNLVPIYEVLDIDGRLYLVAEFCDGPTLASWLRDNADRLSVADSVEIMVRLASAIEHAHGRSLVHRDIKPANIILAMTTNDSKLPFEPRLTDFGLVRDLSQTIDEQTARRLVGTFQYMAPEQFLHSQLDHNEACDQYALGVLFYRLLTGRLPHAEKSGIEMVEAVCTGPPAKLRSVKASVPLDAEAICLRCLELEPDQRYPSVSHLIDDLRRFQQGLEVKARPRGIIERSLTFVGGHPVESALLTLMLIAISSTAVISMSHNRALREQQHVLQVAVSRALDAEALAEESLAGERRQRELALESRAKAKRIAMLSDIKLALASLSRGDAPDAAATVNRIKEYVDSDADNDFAVAMLGNLVGEGTTQWPEGPAPVAEIAPVNSKGQTCIGYVDGTLRMVDDQSGKVVRELVMPEGKNICALAVSENAERIAVGLCDQPGTRSVFAANEVHVFENNDDKPIFTRWGFPTTIESLTFLADPDQLAIGCRYSPVSLISLTDQSFKKVFPSHRRHRELHTSVDGSTITFIHEADLFLQFDSATHEVLRELKIQNRAMKLTDMCYNIHRISVSHDQRYVAVTVSYSDGGRVVVADLSAGSPHEFPGSFDPESQHRREVIWSILLDSSSSYADSVVFSKDNSQLFIGSAAGDVICYDMVDILAASQNVPPTEPTCSDRRVIHQGPVNQLAVDSLGRIISGGEDGRVTVLDRSTIDRSIQSVPPAATIVRHGKETIVSGHTDGSVRLSNAFTGHSEIIVSAGKSNVSELCLDPQGRVLVIGRVNGSVDFLDLDSRKIFHRIPHVVDENSTRNSVDFITMNSEGTEVAICVAGFSLLVLELGNNGNQPSVSLVSEHQLTSSVDAAWFSDSQDLVLLGDLVKQWVRSKAISQTVDSGIGGLTAVIKEPVGDAVYSGARDGRIRRHNLAGKVTMTSDRWPRPTLHVGIDSAITALSVDATGRYLVAGNYTGHLSLWDAETLQYLGHIPTHDEQAPIRRIEIAADNQWMSYLERHVEDPTSRPKSHRPKLIRLE
ncbi:serine/threonine-protein kinase [Rubripirellula amarantea]|nr:serine/threonine-protein kinase [Rubripirellula amarantea]